MAGTFQVLYGNKSGEFKKAATLNGTDDKPLILPAGTSEDADLNRICTRAFACDLDGDGKLDLVAGNFAGTFAFFKGEGKGKFAPKATWLQVDGKPMQVGMHSDPCLVDWDSDGDLDLLSGSGEGGAFLFANTGSKTKPAFGSPITLLDPIGHGMGMNEEPKIGGGHIDCPAPSTRVWVSDVDKDGKLDVLVGDQCTILHLAEGVDAKIAKQKLAAWNKKQSKLFEVLNTEDGEMPDDFNEKYEALLEEKAAFLREETTGFVWLLRRK